MIIDRIEQAVEALRRDRVVAFPTETVYGLGAVAFDPEGVTRIFEWKERPRFDPLIVHVASLDQARSITTDWNTTADLLARTFWPGPLTLVLPKRDAVPDLVTSGLATVGIRMPQHTLSLELISAVGFPMAAPSANRFGAISPTTAQHVEDGFGGKVTVLDGGSCTIGVESTVLDLTGEVPRILRPGGITAEQLQEVLGDISSDRITTTTPNAPGQLLRHYAPHKPMILFPYGTQLTADKTRRCGCIVPSGEVPDSFSVSEVLSEKGNLHEMAINLYAALRHLEQSPVDIIYATEVPETGIGAAINDRLRRAAASE